MEDINKGFIIGIIITLIIVFVFVPQSVSDMNECLCEDITPDRIETRYLDNGTRVVTAIYLCDCSDRDIIDEYISEHPDVCDGLCYDTDWSTYYPDRYALNKTIYYPNGSIFWTRNVTENMTYYEEDIIWN